MKQRAVVGLEATPRLRERMDHVLNSAEVAGQEELKDSLQEGLQRGFVDLRTLRLLVEASERLGLSPVHKEIGHAGLVFPSSQSDSVSVDAELQKRRQFLQMRQEEREYNRMMYGKTENPHVDEVLSMGNQVNTLKTQVATSFNMVFTVVATCGMAYFLASQIGFGHTQALVIALVAAILMMVLEMVLFILRSTEMESHLEGEHNNTKAATAKFRAGALVTPADTTGGQR